MVAPLTSIGKTQQFIFVNGLYYNQQHVIARNPNENLTEDLLPYNNENVITKDNFLSGLLDQCRQKKIPFNAVPVKEIPDFFTESVSYNNFDPNIAYVFDLGNGYLWEQETIDALPTPKTCPQSRGLIHSKNLIIHPFAKALSQAMKNSENGLVDLNAVFTEAIRPKKESEQEVYRHKSSVKPAKIPLEGLWKITAALLTVAYLIGLITIAVSIGAPLLAIPATLFIFTLVKDTATARRLNHYINQHKTALEALNIRHARIKAPFVLLAWSLAIFISIAIQASFLVHFVFLGFVIPTLGMTAGSRTTYYPIRTSLKLLFANHGEFNIAPIPKSEKIKVGLKTVARLGYLSAFISASVLMPVVGVGLLSAALGPVGLGVFISVVAIVVVRSILNDYVQMRLNQLNTTITSIEQNLEEAKALSYTAPAELANKKPVIQSLEPAQILFLQRPRAMSFSKTLKPLIQEKPQDAQPLLKRRNSFF